ncbi:mannose-6-phosphate isomerase, class I [Bacillus sp. 03113]|uniref:mannose-6-phosphate isomerase, class I n=1 Tax=Bacillus sp. 03113 TaxID=2578211 RepID=UPI00114365F7|nr:mannose-6-phosphate isomerase, class I [Bacillus sp. 03113]
MKEPIFFSPIFQERIWGGQQLKTVFHYDIPQKPIGECWAISAHPNGQSIVRNGVYKGETLGSLWENHRELFGNLEGEKFPLLIKILDANDDLSVQVHPNDTYAKEYENGELGKTECWYIIDCDEEAELIFGHTAKTKAELVDMMDSGKWDHLLRRVKVKKGDFFFVPSGTIHALCKGTLILETQQNSDTTYRLYDYDRKDAQGNLRELHLEQSKDVVAVPHASQSLNFETLEKENAKVTKFVEGEYFTVYKWEINGEASFEQSYPFLLCSVIEGEGTLLKDGEKYPLHKGTHFLLPSGFNDFLLTGKLELITSHI